MKRILAHKIIYGDKVHVMSVATISDDQVVSIEPFDRETEATTFIPGTIKITFGDDNSVKIIKV